MNKRFFKILPFFTVPLGLLNTWVCAYLYYHDQPWIKTPAIITGLMLLTVSAVSPLIAMSMQNDK